MFLPFKQLANLITFSRIIGVGLIFYWTPFESTYTQIMTILIYTLICSTDFLDGWVARRYNIVSDIGKVLDPLADKILVLVFLPLVSMKAITPFPVFLILAREFAIMGLRVFSAKQGLIIPANMLGKIKTSVTLPVCGILMARITPPILSPIPALLKPIDSLRHWIVSWPNWAFDTLIWIMVLITIWSLLDYLVHFIYQRKLKTLGSAEQAKKYLYSYIPNGISVLNLMCGIYAIYLILTTTNVRLAAGFILLGVFLDAFDGKVARLLGVHTRFGETLDSKADFVTFGLAPSTLLYMTLSQLPYTYARLIAGIIGIAFYVSVHYRLRRFNKGGHSDYFEGLPSPGGASVVAIMIGSSYPYPLPAIMCTAIVMAFLMVSKLLYPHNRVSDQKILFPYLRKPTLLFWCLIILFYLGVPFPESMHIPEILLGLTFFYIIAPFIPLKKEYR